MLRTPAILMEFATRSVLPNGITIDLLLGILKVVKTCVKSICWSFSRDCVTGVALVLGICLLESNAINRTNRKSSI